MSSLLAVEIAVQDAAGVRIAVDAGASRIELCQALSVGGLTPSMALVEEAVDVAAGRPEFVHVLVRPRGGGFVYDSDEQRLIEREIRLLGRVGVDGVVIGAMTNDGCLDVDLIRRWVAAAAEAGVATVTVHRAIDACAHPEAEIARLAGIGVQRVLTSGGAVTCRDGLTTIAEMVRAAGSIEVMAGGGIAIDDIADLGAAGIAAVHLSARGILVDGGPSGPGGGVTAYDVTDSALVCAAVAEALHTAGSRLAA
ncbi:MAG TPA: copper homeostasis protein CutC [Candidatus Lumbricidophila sp.]|nr:copper homeostasis protein CutC [Candidatus Lumbricidophila sp.]